MTRMSTSVRHFPLYIGGERIDTDERAYGLSVRTVLDPGGVDTVRLFHLLREGSEEELHAHPHVLCSVALATPELGQAALRAAAAAVPRLREVPLAHRIGCVQDLHQAFLDHSEEMSHILRMEGCPGRLADAQSHVLLDLVRPESLEHARSLLRQEITTPRHTIVLQRQPDGVVCIDPPANTPGTGLVAALALLAGNALVIRVPRSCASSLSYALHEILIPVLESHGLPPGAVNVLCGDHEVLMEQWLDSPLVNSIYYFGSSERGLALERKCLAQGKKAILELSGHDGMLVWQDAHLDYATAALIEAFYGSGQGCIIPKYVIAHPAIAGELLDRLTASASALRPGDPELSDTVLSPVLRTTAFHRCLAESLAAGATKMCGGTQIDLNGEPDPHGLFVEPTVLRVDGFERAETVAAVRDETFFPMLTVVVPEDGPDLLDRCIDFLNANRYGLRNSLWTEDRSVIERFTAAVANGGLLKVNDSHVGHVSHLPDFGGTGHSGGTHGELSYPFLRTSRLQAVAIATTRMSPWEAAIGPRSGDV